MKERLDVLLVKRGKLPKAKAVTSVAETYM